MSDSAPHTRWSGILTGLLLCVATYTLAFALRLQEWPSWQNVEFRLGSEMLLATHDAYHWVAGAESFEFGTGHPMSELLRLLALFTGTSPATVAFWLPPVMASLVAALVFAFAWSLGAMQAGVCAGVLASVTPGFLARTLFGYADTDLVTLFLPLLIALIPACWTERFLRSPLDFLPFENTFVFQGMREAGILSQQKGHRQSEQFSPVWIVLLALAGLLSWWGQEWHSLFPYLVRFNAAMIGGLALLFGYPGHRKTTLLTGLNYTMPALAGPVGAIFPIVLLIATIGKRHRFLELLHRPLFLSVLWIMACVLLFDESVLRTMLAHIQAYLKPVSLPPADVNDVLLFPSIARSIIEIQDLSLSEMRLYFHPWSAVTVLGLIGFLLMLCVRSGAFFLLPLAGLALLSTKMGGRMIMFGAPVVAIGLTLPFDWFACGISYVKKYLHPIFTALAVLTLILTIALIPGLEYESDFPQFWAGLEEIRTVVFCCGVLALCTAFVKKRGMTFLCRMCIALLLGCLIIPPLADLIPSMTQGPMINRRHANALVAARSATPSDAILWLWWDWGYAAHHFARRKTIANGAEHGGPSLFLPAAVFATDNPRFARQLVKYTAVKDNVPGNVFKDMTASQAARLIQQLKKPETPLIQVQGKQYLVVSFDMLDLGFWISTFGNWDFPKKEGRGHAISIVPQALRYRLDKGEVVMHNATVSAASIDVFADSGLEHRDYLNPPAFLPDAEAIQAWREDIERRRNVHFLFNKVTGEKLVVDDHMYKTLMVQLLIGKPSNPNFAPWFRLIYDNTFCRIYEVL